MTREQMIDEATRRIGKKIGYWRLRMRLAFLENDRSGLRNFTVHCIFSEFHRIEAEELEHREGLPQNLDIPSKLHDYSGIYRTIAD